MKKLIENYTFDPVAKTITFQENVNLKELLLITNVTDNIMIYNFADPTKGGTITNNVLTLIYNTATMNAGDSLQIYADIIDLNDILTGLLNNQERLEHLMNNVLSRMPYLDTVGRMTIAPVAVTSLPSTLSTVTTVGTVNNMASIGGYQGQLVNMGNSNNEYNFLRERIEITK